MAEARRFASALSGTPNREALRPQSRRTSRSTSRELSRVSAGQRSARIFPLGPPPQKNPSAPSDSRPVPPVPSGIAIFSRTSPVRGSTRLSSLSSPFQVPCQSFPSTQVTPVTKRLDTIVRSIAPSADPPDGPVPGGWQAHARSAGRSSGCRPRRAGTGARRRRPFRRARRPQIPPHLPRSPSDAPVLP